MLLVLLSWCFVSSVNHFGPSPSWPASDVTGFLQARRTANISKEEEFSGIVAESPRVAVTRSGLWWLMWSEFIHPLSSSHPTSSLRSGFFKWLHTCKEKKKKKKGNVGWKDIFFFPPPHYSLTAPSILAAFALKTPPKVTAVDLPPLSKRRDWKSPTTSCWATNQPSVACAWFSTSKVRCTFLVMDASQHLWKNT